MLISAFLMMQLACPGLTVLHSATAKWCIAETVQVIALSPVLCTLAGQFCTLESKRRNAVKLEVFGDSDSLSSAK